MSEVTAKIELVPGWQGSGPAHWQSLWLTRLPQASMLALETFETPKRQEWVGALSREILARPEPVIIVAHSLGCLAASHLSPQAAAQIRGALLVAPIDPDKKALFSDFGPVPAHRLPYRSIVVASTNDSCCSVRLAAAYARAWASEFVRVPSAGHLNVASGHGPWPLGWALLQSLLEPVSLDSPLHSPLKVA